MGKLPLYFNSLLGLPAPLITTENPTGNFYLVRKYLCTYPFICNRYIYIFLFRDKRCEPDYQLPLFIYLCSRVVSAGRKDTELKSNHPTICHGSSNITLVHCTTVTDHPGDLILNPKSFSKRKIAILGSKEMDQARFSLCCAISTVPLWRENIFLMPDLLVSLILCLRHDRKSLDTALIETLHIQKFE